jgi:hypothetical protein
MNTQRTFSSIAVALVALILTSAFTPHLTPAFDVGALAQQMSALSFPDRVCAFHRYKIQNKADTLYQILPSQQ